MGILRPKNRPLTEQESAALHTQNEIITDEALKDEVPPLQYATNDADVINVVNEDKELKPLSPLYSQLLRLTKISDKEKHLFQLDVDLIIGTMEVNMNEDEYDAGKWAKLQSHGIFLKNLINDSHKGFKMTLLSRVRKEIVFNPKEKERHGVFN